MKEKEAITLVDDTFTRPYDEARLRVFLHNLFHEYERLTEKASVGRYIPEAFEHSIVSCKRLAKFTDPQGMRLDVLSVKLRSRRTLENARTMQRNFIARYLNGGRGGALKDAALVAFYADDSEDWRFSLVRMDYVLDEEKQKIKKALTPARRYSFLVGTGEKTHTARRQLLPILQSPAETTLTELENAFNIETVTNEFFRQYKALYLSLKAALDNHVKNDEITRKEFAARGIDTAGFAKRLLGQIVFLYFLQKKGWLGVARGAQWGTGPKDFLQRLYRAKNYHNFFNDVLEHLFYDALATERQTQDHYFPRLECKIPFLNGGLFEPFKGYAWDGADILLDDKIFGDIIEIFDLYNFTVREDEPLDKEVAVDPEMLGKVFENLIPENERKGSGTFYTPREIVHYMCQESLVNYLDASLNISSRSAGAETRQALSSGAAPEYEEAYTPRVAREDIAEFIYHGDTAREHDATAQSKNANGDYKGGYRHKIPASVREHAREIDAALAGVKICDPAIGSGAFPVGVMNEIVRARAGLNAYLGEDGRAAYDFKRHAIQESIHGVDIEPSAVDIAKLRLWLSLIVDEEDFGTIKPLPNLEYKIMAGDSLISEISQKDLGYKGWLDELVALQKSIFSEYSPSKKREIKAKIDVLLDNLFQGYDSAFRFNYWIQFYDVMNRGGFDIVIANPPYVSHDKITFRDNLKRSYISFNPYADLYCYFLELAIKILTQNGTISFITSNSYLRADYGAPLRELLNSNTSIRSLINLEKSQVFDTAIVNTAIITAQKTNTSYPSLIVNSQYNQTQRFSNFINQNKFYYQPSDFKSKSWTLAPAKHVRLLSKIEASGVRLKNLDVKIRLGLATGSNTAFLLDKEMVSRLVKSDRKNLNIIKPVLRGREIERFHYNQPEFHILLTRNEIDVQKNYPDVYIYLDQFGDKFKNRGAKGRHWTNLRACAFFEDFKKPKIIWIELADKGRFALCTEEIYLVNSAYFMLIPDGFKAEYLLGILNSKLIHFYLKSIAATSGMGTTRWINNYVQEFPIPKIPVEKQESIFKLVKKILDTKKKKPELDIAPLEYRIDQIVYDLYGLQPEEIAIIENVSNS